MTCKWQGTHFCCIEETCSEWKVKIFKKEECTTGSKGLKKKNLSRGAQRLANFQYSM